MSLFGFLFEKRDWIDTGNLTDYSDFWYGIGGSTSSSGQQVTAQEAMKYWAYYACVSLIAQTQACFPLVLKRKSGKTSVDAIEEPLYHLAKLTPNPNWTSFYWREFGQTMQFNEGNDYTWIERNRLGIKALWPLNPYEVTPKLAKGGERVTVGARIRTMKAREKYYKTKDQNGSPIVLFNEDVLHIPGVGFDGEKGLSFVRTYGIDVIGRGLSQNEFSSKWFKNGVFTSGTFEHPNALGDKAQQFREAVKQRYSGTYNTGIPMVLEDGMKWNSLKPSLVDQQFLEQEKETALQICGMLHVPPHKISIPTTHQAQNNTEEMNKHFLDTTMLPWVVRREQLYDSYLLTEAQRREGLFFKHNFDHILRPDAKTRAEIAKIRNEMGIPVNRYLQKEDEEPTVHGDTEWISQNLASAEAKIKEAEEPQEEESQETVEEDDAEE
jgi:HK97 family phage portal protein